MLTAALMLAALLAGHRVPGRHLLLSAHPDDETISASRLLSVADVTILQLTSGVSESDKDRSAIVAMRLAEREAALTAGGWAPTVIDTGVAGRASWAHLPALVAAAIGAGAEVIWTHPYEGGHLDHDTAAWVAQTVADRTGARRMEFASYHMDAQRHDHFGVFWPDRTVPAVRVKLTGKDLARKQAAMRAHGSQASILRKFRTSEVEVYREAPRYDFSKPSPPPVSRWDTKGYRPSTAEWRALVPA